MSRIGQSAVRRLCAYLVLTLVSFVLQAEAQKISAAEASNHIGEQATLAAIVAVGKSKEHERARVTSFTLIGLSALFGVVLLINLTIQPSVSAKVPFSLWYIRNDLGLQFCSIGIAAFYSLVVLIRGKKSNSK